MNDGLSVSNRSGIGTNVEDLRIMNIISGLLKTKLRAVADKIDTQMTVST